MTSHGCTKFPGHTGGIQTALSLLALSGAKVRRRVARADRVAAGDGDSTPDAPRGEHGELKPLRSRAEPAPAPAQAPEPGVTSAGNHGSPPVARVAAGKAGEKQDLAALDDKIRIQVSEAPARIQLELQEQDRRADSSSPWRVWCCSPWPFAPQQKRSLLARTEK